MVLNYVWLAFFLSAFVAALVQTLEQEEVWVNRTLTPGLPMFGAAVRVDGKLRALVLLYDAGGEQLCFAWHLQAFDTAGAYVFAVNFCKTSTPRRADRAVRPYAELENPAQKMKEQLFLTE